MEMNERIKLLRNALNLTQTEFGGKIGLKQNTIGQIENGQRGITDRTIILLAQTYNASEEWLRTGQGNMLLESDNTILAALVAEHGLDGVDAKILETYIHLPDEHRTAVRSFLLSLAEAVQAGKVSSLDDFMGGAPDAPEVNGEEEAARSE